ncbi:MAG: hypothetical protein HKN14_03490 [Marinicaulis sp.]|nr:hypothetical protein [Marinicaulis sp.]NNE39966.1 hypothetical protein [Marinicaulis sp.]
MSWNISFIRRARAMNGRDAFIRRKENLRTNESVVCERLIDRSIGER